MFRSPISRSPEKRGTSLSQAPYQSAAFGHIGTRTPVIASPPVLMDRKALTLRGSRPVGSEATVMGQRLAMRT